MSASQHSPLATTIQAREKRLPPCNGLTASSGRSSRSGNSAASVTVPGVTMRTIRRSTRLLACAGSPICSQIATDSPSLSSRAR